MNQPSLLDWPTERNYKRTGTSQAAAASIAPKAQTLRERVYDAFTVYGPMTADEAAQRLGLTVLSIRPRVTELLSGGLLHDTGATRANESGKQAMVLEAQWLTVLEIALRIVCQAPEFIMSGP